MAKIILGAFVTGIRGKIGGTLFTKNGSGVSAGKITTTAKKAKPKGMFQASIVGAAARAWKTLDPAVRTAFNTNAGTYPRTNSLGQVYTLSGFQLYTAWFINCRNCTGITLNEFNNPADPAFNVNSIELTSIVFSIADGLQVAYNSDAVNVVTVLQVFVSRPVSAGKSTVSGAYKNIGQINDTYVNPAFTAAEYTALYGAPQIDNTVFVKIIVINSESGIAVELVNNYKVTVEA